MLEGEVANTFIGVLRSRNFLKLWIGQVSSQLAYNIVNFVIVLHIYELTGSSTSISLVLIASALPSVLFGPFSGVLADRIDYKKILVYTSFLRFFAVLILIFSKNNVLGLLEIVFLISLISQFFSPAESSSIPLIVKEKKLVAANSVVVTTTYITMLLGYSLAGPLMEFLTTRGTLLFAASLYLVGSYSIYNMRKYDFKKTKKITLSNLATNVEQVWNQTKSSFSSLKDNTQLYLPITKLTLGWVVLGAFIVLMPAFAEQEINLTTKLVGPLLIAPAGLGMLIGSYALDKKKTFTYNKAANIGFVFTGLSLFLFSIHRYYDQMFFAIPAAVLLMIAMGTFCSVVYVSSQTMLHVRTDENIRGRIFGISSMFTNLAMSIPAIVVGGISDLSSPFAMILTMSIITMCYGVYSYKKETSDPYIIGLANG